MKRLKKSRVSWPSDSMLCQVKMFLSEDCPAKVASNSNLLPPGFEATEYATKRPYISHIPRIKWKRPPKYILDDALLVASGGESTETRVENLRISKVFEAFYPHRSVIPTSPSSVSQAVEDESYDDSKTPNIRLSPVEDNDEQEASALPPSGVSGLGPDLSIVVSAALSALMRTKEQGSLVDADLLVKLLSDPNIVKNLMNEMAGKPLQTANHTLNTNFTIPSVGPPQHVTSSSPMTQSGNGVPHTVPLPVQSTVSVATAQPVSSALSMKPPSVFHPHPLSSGLNPLVRLQDSYTTAPMKPIIVDAVIVSQPKTAPKPQSQSLNICTSSTTWNANKVQESGPTGPNPQIRNGASYLMNIYRDDKVSAKPLMKPSTVDEGVVSQQKTVPKPLNISTSNNWNTNRVPESAQTGPDPQIHNGADPVNVNSDDQVSAKPPVKSLEYFKNLIREHGGVTQATNESNSNYKGRFDNNDNNVKVVKATKFKKPCMYFGRARGCKLGESCLYLHDGSKRLWTADVAAKFPRAKRLKFGT